MSTIEEYAARPGREALQDTVELSAPGGARCVVLPSAGSQLASLRLAPQPGQPAVEVLYAPGPEDRPRSGTGFGAPVLFPWPGRITGGEYAYGGHEYRVPGAGGRHALHGFVHAVPWQIVGYGADTRGAWVQTRVAHAALGLGAGSFPGLYALDLTHRLEPGGYVHEVRVRNVGETPFPFGYGWHPYFRAPLAAGAERAECVVRLAARARWELSAALVPTGRRVEALGPYDLAAGRRLGDKAYDDVFTFLDRDGSGWSRAELFDPAAGLSVVARAGPSFPHWVVYGPRALPAVCLEPWTCLPDAFNLEPRGVSTGLRELLPGEEWSDRVVVGLAPA